MTNTELLRESIKKNEFISFLRGVDGYQSNDRFNPSPIPYKDNLLSLYEFVQNEDGAVSLFVDSLKSIGTDCEGIYIVANYLYILIYHIHKGVCTVQIDYKEIVEFLSNSIADKKDILVNTTKLSRLGINGSIYEKLQGLDHNCYTDNKEHLFFEKESSNDDTILSTNSLMGLVNKNIINGEKIPHSVSRPVLYKDADALYLAVFVFFYNREDIENGAVDRPTLWALADISSGEIVKRYQSKDKDFSNSSYDKKYNVRSDKKYDTSKEYYERAYGLLDKIREHYLKSGEILNEDYEKYIQLILANIPDDYKRFYNDLSHI